MRIFVISFIANLIVIGVLAKTDCRVRLQQCENKKPSPRKPVCGTDNQTYPNRCALLRVQCTQNSPLTVKHRGKCKEKQPCWIDQGKKLNRNSGRDQRAGADSIPECLADGTYAPVQCHKSAGYCWCVSPNGEMIPRTSVKHRRPECPKRGRSNGSLKDFADDTGNSSKKGCDPTDKNIFVKNLVRIFKTEFNRNVFEKQHAFPVHQNATTLEESAMQWKFVTLDKDKNNLLHKNEYRDLRKLVKKVVKPRRCSRMFIRLCDVNQNSVISKEEWMNCLKVNSSGVPFRPHSMETTLSPDTDAELEDIDLVKPERDPASVLEESVLPLTEDSPDNEEQEHEGKVNDCQSDRQAVLDEPRFDWQKMYIPECTKDGRYNKVQCYRSTGYCWCVLEDSGKPIPGTSVKDTNPKCDTIPNLMRPMTGCPDHKKVAFINNLMDFFHRNLSSSSSNNEHNSKENQNGHEQTASRGFHSLDVNKNEVLDRSEWKSFRSMMSTNKVLRRCGRKFPRYCDVNQDKKITMTEWMQCLSLETVTSLGAISDTHSSSSNRRRGKNPIESFLKEDD